jgi:GntR family transcriptional regulator
MQQPLYLKLEESLRDMIDGSEYEPGDQIPSERELAEKLKASRMTVRRAVELLTAQGLLERRSTSGTFVSEPNVIRSFLSGSVQSLTRQIQTKGGTAGSKLLMFDKISAPAKITYSLNLRSGSKVFVIQRLRLTNNLPFCIETSYLPIVLFKELSEENVSGQESLYEHLKMRYGIIPARSTDKLKITWPTEQEAQLLGLSLKDPVLYFRSIVFNSDGVAFEFVKSINHPIRVAFQSETIVKGEPQKTYQIDKMKDPI